MSLNEIPLKTLHGEPTSLADHAGKALLIVNVASKCGLTPQYTGLEAMHEKYKDRGFSVIGVPCNQFGGQEPGSSEEIAEFCSATYGVTFPMTEKVDVNGADRHPVYADLVETPDQNNRGGDVSWNFEKFLLASDGAVIARFSPDVEPDDPRLLRVLEAELEQAA